MELKIIDVAKLLQVTTKTVYRWVYDEKIPFYRVNRQYRFDHRQLEDWAAAQGKVPAGLHASSTQPGTLADLIDRGGVHYRLEGTTMVEAINHASSLFPDLGGSDPATLLDALVRREEMQCTGLGSGIALPHPRTPAIRDPRHEFVAICMTEEPIPADTVDGDDVHTLLFVVCSEEIRHVRIMAKVSHLCRQEKFISLLRNRALRSEVSSFINDQLNS